MVAQEWKKIKHFSQQKHKGLLTNVIMWRIVVTETHDDVTFDKKAKGGEGMDKKMILLWLAMILCAAGSAVCFWLADFFSR